MTLQNAFSAWREPALVEYPGRLPRRGTKARAAARFSVEYDEARHAFTVSYGRVHEGVEYAAEAVAWLALYDQPVRRLVPDVKRALRHYRREGEAFIRAIKRYTQVTA